MGTIGVRNNPLLNSLIVFSLLSATLLSGCLGDLSSPQQPHHATEDLVRVEPGQEHVGALDVSVQPPIRLGQPYGIEPSVTTTEAGTVVVTAPIGRADPTVLAQGGAVWVSHDRGASFELVRGPSVDEAMPVTCSSCDADVVAWDGQIAVGTFYATTAPAWNVNIVRSEDEGRSWELAHPGPAEEPIDRPWLTADRDGRLHLFYRTLSSREENTPLPGPERGTVFHQVSEDAGRTWTRSKAVLEPGNQVKPRPLPSGGVVLPFQLFNASSDYEEATNWVLKLEPGGETEKLSVSAAYTRYADFDYSVDVAPDGRVFAAWSAPAGEDGTQTLHVRVSPDGGASWGPVRTVDLPGSVMQPWVAIREDGLVAVAYYGSEARGPVLEIPEGTPWNPRMVLLALEDPAEARVLANLTAGPTFDGLYCNSAPACPPGERTAMAEFLSVAWGPDGSAYVAAIDAINGADGGRFELDEGPVVLTRVDVGTRSPAPTAWTLGHRS